MTITNNLLKLIGGGAVIASLISTTFAQKPIKTKTVSKPKTIVFAVLDDGKTLEPIAEIEKGALVDTSASGGDLEVATAFVNNYYKPNTTYNLIFGGASNGTVTVKSSNPKAECSKNVATVTTLSSKAKLKGFVMGLATNQKPAKTVPGTRRLPTAAERSDIESLVRAELTKQGVSANAQKKLNYYNLTALDVDNDGKAEMVGSYWVESSAKERNSLFFIADKGADGKYQLGYSEYEKITPDKIMSGDFKDLEGGIGSELLLDALDYDGDATAEIFTLNAAFEGNNFHVYSRKDSKWARVYEGYNYHCAY